MKKCERPLNILEISQKGKEQHIFGPVQSFEISALTKGFSEDLTHTLDYTQWIIHKLMKLGMCIQESSDCQIDCLLVKCCGKSSRFQSSRFQSSRF